MRSALLLATLLLIAAALQACGSSEGASRTSEVVDSAGIRIVYSHEPRWPEGRAWQVDPEPLLSIGTVEGPEAYMFSRVSGAARLSDGRIVVLNGAPRQVRLYGSDGAFLRGVGGPGQGPGEFQALSQVLVGPGDTLVVWDSQAYRVTRFSPEGGLSRTDTFDRSRLWSGPTAPQHLPPARVGREGGDRTAPSPGRGLGSLLVPGAGGL